MGEIEPIGVADKTGIRKNLTELFAFLEKGELKALGLVYLRKDEPQDTLRTFYNGDDYEVIGMLEILKHDILENQDILTTFNFERLE